MTKAAPSGGISAMLERAFVITRWIGALAFVAVFATFIIAVFMRYVAGQPIQWSDEFVTIASIWIVFWMSAFVIRDREQVSIDFIYTKLGPQGRRILNLFTAVAFGAVFAASLPSVLDYILFLKGKYTDILEWRLDLVFLCLPLFFAAIVFRSITTVVRMLSPSWRQHVEDGGGEAATPDAAV